jgi:enoyl-CoA hydratase/carnithine racemase
VNALTEPMLDQLLAALKRAADDPLIRAVDFAQRPAATLLRWPGPRRSRPNGEPDLRALVEKLYVGIYDAQSRLGKPSIAAVNGTARGGGMTLAISCDLIVAARSATFGYPEIDVGLIPLFTMRICLASSVGIAPSICCSRVEPSTRLKPHRSGW